MEQKTCSSTEYQQEDMARLLARASSLRRQKNARAPALRLPVEIVLNIFSVFPASPLSPHVLYSRPPPWLAVTHVCQRWREISLSSPSLWTHIITETRHWAGEMLIRSKNLPIVLQISPLGRRPSGYKSSSEVALSQASRACFIDIDGFNIWHRPSLCVPAPILESLYLRGALFSPTLPIADIFPEGTPKLRSLCLQGLNISWPLHLLNPDLVELTLDDICEDDRPSLLQLREALSAMPNLNTLSLKHTLPLQSQDSTPHTIMATWEGVTLPTLPSITTLEVAGQSGMEILGFTSSFTFPSLTSVVIGIGWGAAADLGRSSVQSVIISLSGLYRQFTSRLSGPSPYSFHSLRIARDEYDYWCMQAGGQTSQDVDRGCPPWIRTHFDPFFTVNVHRDSPRLAAEDLFKTVCELLPLQNIGTLMVECELFTAYIPWVEAFSRMKDIQNVIVRGSASGAIIEALNDLHAVGAWTQHSATLAEFVPFAPFDNYPTIAHDIFPRMSHLAIGGIDMEIIPEVQAIGETPISLCERLRLALARRLEEGNGMQPLERLGVRDCNITQAHVMQLGEVITHGAVDWDSVQNPHLFGLAGLIVDTSEESDA
ncbi:hypothetical protein BV25DRAFT_1593602 [Artomyces pyxidatus]|uniref:Uncharacterized protein n=1 Tax=Artomyces pyxidatus TaxID=48021 RepID=A0ACB8TC56_9AGAM|nr:hypothetical protein BV25DRAFT_1593602 [Artomyces pyxidatus]